MGEYIYERPDEPAKIVRDGWNVHIEWGFQQREEIVRCSDCKWLRVGMSDHEYRSGYWCDMGRFDPKPDGFCAWGERKRAEDGDRG